MDTTVTNTDTAYTTWVDITGVDFTGVDVMDTDNENGNTDMDFDINGDYEN